MPRPYLFANDDDAVDVIRHDGEFIDRYRRKMFGNRVPAVACVVTRRIIAVPT
jgi:hypothetical protein